MRELRQRAHAGRIQGRKDVRYCRFQEVHAAAQMLAVRGAGSEPNRAVTADWARVTVAGGSLTVGLEPAVDPVRDGENDKRGDRHR